MSKTAIILIMTIIVTACITNSFAQEAPTPATPAVPDNAVPGDNSIKMRSVELERIKRAAEKTAVLRRDNGKELKFSIIKEDFEGIQKEQMSIIEAYTMEKNINYTKIGKSADKITEMAVRLRANVFESKEKKDAGAPTDGEENPYIGKSLRNLIVELDNAIGKVVLSPMWQQLKVVDSEISQNVEANLVEVIKASNALWIESNKMRSK